ncbi:TolC family outer membrane protein [Piscinibacter gummiphilus]|uniref:TolC family outer membrane protein n=1 Tax=Piscinibacter gummiphilus TaxID=946333 RepID=A0ABZ0D4L7_9BURK|nr:TolC family outer membrane protein [Piscinibacter gummiphilus]WOB10260.1 TolC family outer membrane protein [Piscinibacter gummiphilus]
MSPAFTPRRLALAAAFALGALSTAHAQSLQELYDTARGYDATYLAARALADSTVYKAEGVHSLRRPNVGATVGYARTTNETPATESENRGPTAALNAKQTLFNRANDATISQADLGVEAARADLALAEQDLIVRVANAYFDVLGAQDALTTARASTKAISEQLASAKRNFEVGTATITDTREAQARYDLATAQELAAENDLLNKRIALDQLVGRSNVEPKPLATPVVLPPVMPADVNSWVSLAEGGPGVRKAQVGYEVAQLETSKARAGHLPTVDLSGSYGQGRATGFSKQGSLPVNRYNGDTNQSSIGVTVNIPLFAGFAIQNRVKETLLLEEQSRNNLDAARRSANQAARQAYYGSESLQARVRALEAAETSSQVALDATQLGYKVGVRVNLDVLNAQTQLYSTRRDLARARYDVLVNTLRLKQAAGQLSPADVAAINQLLVK